MDFEYNLYGGVLTNAKANNTKRDRNGLAGYDSRSCRILLTGNFPKKRHICVLRHKGVRRDWCVQGDTLASSKRTNRDTNSLSEHNFEN